MERHSICVVRLFKLDRSQFYSLLDILNVDYDWLEHRLIKVFLDETDELVSFSTKKEALSVFNSLPPGVVECIESWEECT